MREWKLACIIIKMKIERGSKMANVSMSGRGRLTNHTACEAAYEISNSESKKLSCWKRLWQILNMPIRIRMRSSE